MQLDKLDSVFLNYVIDQEVDPGERLPTLAEMSNDIGISVGKLREQLEVARSLGLVSVRPRVGIQRESFDFLPAVRTAALFGVGTGEVSFHQFSQLRRALETGLWHDAVVLLTPEDKDPLREIVDRAWDKLHGEPVHIPNPEHRNFHLTIYSRLKNPFVRGVLEAYWDIYEASELTRLASYRYWLHVWEYHERIVDALCEGAYARGLDILVEHFTLLPTVSDNLPPNGDGNVPLD